MKESAQNMNPIDKITIGKSDNLEGYTTLSRVLATKAEKEDLNRLNEIKANREDTEDM